MMEASEASRLEPRRNPSSVRRPGAGFWRRSFVPGVASLISSYVAAKPRESRSDLRCYYRGGTESTTTVTRRPRGETPRRGAASKQESEPGRVKAPAGGATHQGRKSPMDVKRTGKTIALAGAILLAGVVVLPALAKNVKLPEGKKIHFTLNQTLRSDRSREGDKFSAVVSRNVRVGDKTVIPEGAVVRGTVTSVKRSGRVKGKAEMELSFDEIELPNGKTLDLAASLTELDDKEEVTEEGGVQAEGTKKRDAATIGAGAGIGAAIGGIAGGGKGAAIGAGAGAAAGAGGVPATRGKEVYLKRGTEMAIQLDRSLTVPVD